MIRWEYRVVTYKDGFVSYNDGSENLQKLALESGLRLLGSQGFELVATIMSQAMLGHALSHQLIFKRPAESQNAQTH